MMTPHVPRDERLSPWRLSAFSALTVTIAGASFPLTAYLPAFYAQHYGMSLGTIGLVIMLVRIADAGWDPLVGLLSDRGTSRFGRRRIWILVGLPIYILATATIFIPVGSPGPVYLGIGLLLLYASWTMLQIPYSAWSGELSGHYHERTRVQTYLGVAGAIGLMMVLLVPALLDQLGHSAQSAKVAAMGWFIIGSAIIGGVLTLRSFREAPPPVQGPSLRFVAAIRILASDRLLMRILASDFIVTFGQLARGSLMLFFFTQYMDLGKAVSLIFVLQYVFGIVAGPIWLQVGYRLGKHKTVVFAELLQAAINLAIMLVTPGAVALLLALIVMQGLTQSSGNLMLRAIVADIADKQRLESGQVRTGLLFSVFGLSTKAAMAIAVGVTLPLVSWLGFRASGPNDASALFSLKCVFALVPFAAHTLSAILMIRFPLDESRHAEIRAMLDAQDIAAEATGSAETQPGLIVSPDF